MDNAEKKKFYIVTVAKVASLRIEATSQEEAELLADRVTDDELGEAAAGWDTTDCFAEDGSDD
jgi:hypothetical protein